MNVVPPARLAEWQRLSPWSLTWADVDPARHPFEPGSAGEVVRGLPPSARTPTCPSGPSEDGGIEWRDEAGRRWSAEMTAALVDHYGRWTCGWWSPIGAAHLGDRIVDRTLGRSPVAPEVNLEVVTEGLVAWRDWLTELAERFARFLPALRDTRTDVVLDGLEPAVAHLVTVVLDRTCAEGGWYRHCEFALGWLLSAGVPERRHEELLRAGIGGRFSPVGSPRRTRTCARSPSGSLREVDRRAR
ncbi:hypothetical protein AB0I37_12405 [Micromonospora purpureochromogenes]|uniref:hypothetical protein n=1 Tax=Micromonospora purpureochromogenes TaxID=47872 RepID=UPI00340C0839